MKTSLFPVRDLRFFLGREADRRRLVRPAGAFGQKNTFPGGGNRWGDSSTRHAINRILKVGETQLKAAVTALSTEKMSVFVRNKANNGYEEVQGPRPVLPTNWGVCPSSFVSSMSWKGWYSVPNEDMERCARTAGWMKAMGELVREHPAWFRRAAKALAKAPLRGMNSPRNYCHNMTSFLTGSSLERWETPGRAYRAISHGIRRAKEILSGFNITNVPWAAVMDELSAPRGPKRGNKLGQRLALRTLAQFTGMHIEKFRVTEFVRFRGFRHDLWRAMEPEAREFFRMKMREGQHFNQIVLPPTREDDGVKMFNVTSVTVRGHEVTEGWVVEMRSGRGGGTYFTGLRRQTVVQNLATNRTYHLEWCPSEMPGELEVLKRGWSPQGTPEDQIPGQARWGAACFEFPPAMVGKKIGGSVIYWRRMAIRKAGEAWATQDREMKVNGLELPANLTVLAYVEDSYDAGNCSAGTAAFMAANCWGNRRFVPVQWLLNKESRAQAAARVALRKFWASPEAQQLAS